MGDLQVGEIFKHRCFVTVAATGVLADGLADITCTIYDEGGVHHAGTVAELSHGWYHVTDFTPDAEGAWTLQWSKTVDPTDYTFSPRESIFKVGGGEVTDIKTETALIVADTNELQTDWANAGRLDAILDIVAADTPYIADAALPAAPTANSLASRLRSVSLIETTIGPNNRSTTSCELVAGDTHNNAYTNLLVVLDNNEGNLNYVSRTITAYTGASKTVTWTPAITHDAVDGGRIWIVANDTKINVTCDAIKARTDNRLQTVTFFSPCQIEAVADTSHTDASLPTVTIPNWTGTIVHVYAGFKFRMVENTNAAVNKLSGAQEIQINKAGGAWTDAINLVDDQFGLAASTREGGDVVMGIIDLVGTIDVFNTTAQFQWDEPLTDQDALHFNDVQTFVIIQYY
jgi:hypothetical protein